MTEREKDVAIAKAMGLTVKPFAYRYVGDAFDCHSATEEDLNNPEMVIVEYIKTDKDLVLLPRYESPEGSWSVLDYIRDHPDSKFALAVSEHIAMALDWFGWVDEGGQSVVNQVLAKLTPSLIRDAAYEAAKECSV